MWGGVTVKTPAAIPPLDVAGLKSRLKIEHAEDDALLGDFLGAALGEIDGPTGIGIALMAQVWTLTLDCFAGEIELPGWPVTAVNEVRYYDRDGIIQVLDPATYRLAGGSDPRRLVRAFGASWPATAYGRGVVEIDYALGAADRSTVPADLITALAMLAGSYNENREAVTLGGKPEVIPLGAAHILARFSRIPAVA